MFFNRGKRYWNWEIVLSLFFPKVCGICKIKIIKNYTCEKCCNILQYTMKRQQCVRNINSYVDQLYSLFLYQSFIRDALLAFKFNGKAYIGNTFAACICDIMKQYNIHGDWIIPVPIHRKRYKQRGYNQSEILSSFISKRMQIKHSKKMLMKVKHNRAQSTIDIDSRKANVENVYQFNKKYSVCGKTIVLIDDIYTTGATANECAKVLKQNGAKKVICITVAYSRGTQL